MPPQSETIWSVSALNFEIKTLLEKGIGAIWIEGEISNFAQPASGHWYFSLKDERAQLRAAMFRNRNSRVGFKPKNGQQVLIRAQVTLYEARGDFQVIVEHMEKAGVGRLMREYEELKRRLSAEGLFAEAHKKPIPLQATRIGIITSASGAAIRDALSVIQRRSPVSQVTLITTHVQGEQAAPGIVDAIRQANQYGQLDVLLLIRGGGSLEDLWCFNDERVARAIHASTCPVVTGIGHEIDFTIADFVADFRAPTPSVAAETITMDQYEVMQSLDRLQTRIYREVGRHLTQRQDGLKKLAQRLLSRHPSRQISTLQQQLQVNMSRLIAAEKNRLHLHQNHCYLQIEQLKRHSPRDRMPVLAERLDHLVHQLKNTMQSTLQRKQLIYRLQIRSLQNLSPLQTLARGFATVSKDDQIVTRATMLETDDEVLIRFEDGSRRARVL